MVLYRRRARFGCEAHAGYRKRRHYVEDFQVHFEETDVVDLRLLLHVSGG